MYVCTCACECASSRYAWVKCSDHCMYNLVPYCEGISSSLWPSSKLKGSIPSSCCNKSMMLSVTCIKASSSMPRSCAPASICIIRVCRSILKCTRVRVCACGRVLFVRLCEYVHACDLCVCAQTFKCVWICLVHDIHAYACTFTIPQRLKQHGKCWKNSLCEEGCKRR